ncbi:hypothetical protein [Clostridium botulinum]|uniref:hypothetical protein n=1 Tax=Clostridium botulinum TaxID=1491 RepID=UPI001FAF341A|nr:hypothetical protein [Clostridium botulinum]
MKKTKILKILVLALAITSLGGIISNKVYADSVGWKLMNNNWYYSDSIGGNLTGWLNDKGTWYYLNDAGVMKTGWINDNGKWYYLNSNGSMVENDWLQSANGKWYYLGDNGVMLSNTTIENCTLGSDGAWKVTATTPFKWIDAQGEHIFRIDIAPRPDDKNAGNALSSYNLELSEDDKSNLDTLAYNISKETLYLSEAKSQCIGKTVGNKVITDIKFYKEIFKDIQGIDAVDRIKTIKSSNIYNYKSTSPYMYDEFLVFSGINERNSEWECMRVIIEFEEL